MNQVNNSTYPTDMLGYGQNTFEVTWPNKARVPIDVLAWAHPLYLSQ
ncbi:MAG: hypothetical protein ACJAVV_001824 [Alphaproteobacteria bacterium]|jgi:hypothetical protein